MYIADTGSNQVVQVLGGYCCSGVLAPFSINGAATRIVNQVNGYAGFQLADVAAGVVAPVVEEIFFRGFLFGLLRRRHPLWLAYIVSAVLFTVLHNDPSHMNLAQMAGLSIGICMLAVMLAWVYQRTGSLYPGILAHAVNNATGLILFYVVGIS